MKIRNFTKKFNLIYYGSNHFSIKPLNKIIEIQKRNTIIDKVLVITTESRSSYKKENDSFKNYCINNNIKYLDIFHYDKKIRKQKINSIKDEIINNYDIGIVCSFKYMIPSYLIKNMKKGIFVIHPSLLPLYRGANPIQFPLLNGDKFTGSTIVGCSEYEFDAGKIYLQKKIKIKDEYKYPELKESLNELSSILIENFLNNYNYIIKKGVDQKIIESYAPIFKTGDNLIEKENKIKDVYNKFRSFYNSSLNNIYFKFENKEFIIEDLSLDDIIFDINIDKKLFKDLELGSIFIHKHKKYLTIKFIDGFITIKKGYIIKTNKVEFIKYHPILVDKKNCKLFLNNKIDNLDFIKKIK